MRDSRYSIFASVLLGVAHMCMFVGYDFGGLVVESVLRSAHDRHPEDMDTHAGYIGSAILNGFHMFGSVTAPVLLTFFSAKQLMITGSLFFTIYFASFVTLNQLFIYIGNGCVGFFYAVFNVGYYVYLTQIATSVSFAKICGYEWAITNFSTFIGALIYIPLVTSGNSTDLITAKKDIFRYYSDEQIKMLFGAFTALGGVANLICCCLPTRCVENSIYASNLRESKHEESAWDEIKSHVVLTKRTFINPTMATLTLFFVYFGVQNAFWLTVYPTTLQFTTSLSQWTHLVAYYGAAFSVGVFIMGTATGPISKRIKNFGRLPSLAIAFFVQLVSCLLVLFSTSDRSTFTPNDDKTLLLDPNVAICLVVGVLFGVLDCALTTIRNVVCAMVKVDRRPQVFAFARFYQALGGTTFLLLVSEAKLSMFRCLGLLGGACLLGNLCYLWVDRKLRRKDVQIHDESKLETASIIELS